MKHLPHILIPSLLPIAFFAVAATPVEVLRCRNRGLLALLIAFASALTGWRQFGQCMGGCEADSGRWVVSALILAIAPVALIFLA